MNMYEIITEGVKISIPIMIASFGGLLSELSGILNISLEGEILFSAFFSVFFANLTHSLLIGLMAGIFSSVVLSFVFIFFSFTLSANIFLVGLGINILSSSLTLYMGTLISGEKGTIIFKHIPHLGLLWIYISLLIFPIMQILIYKTRIGFHIRAVGNNEKAAIFSGINPIAYKIQAIIIGGILCGISGFFISIPLGVFIQNMSGGRGWLAIVAIFLGGRAPWGIFIASLFIGITFTLAHLFQVSINMDPEIAMIIPYIASILFLIFYKKRR